MVALQSITLSQDLLHVGLGTKVFLLAKPALTAQHRADSKEAWWGGSSYLTPVGVLHRIVQQSPLQRQPSPILPTSAILPGCKDGGMQKLNGDTDLCFQ